MNTIAKRLKKEREAKGLNAEAFGAIGGVKRAAQFTYEKEGMERYPDAKYLANIDKIGCDILYIVTGIRSKDKLIHEISELVYLYEQANEETKSEVLLVLKKYSKT